jgi:hypothetical protein
MFIPVAVDNIAFPESSSLSTLDFVPESFDAFQAYSNVPTSSLYTTQSIQTNTSFFYRTGVNADGRILCVPEGGGNSIVWNTNNDTSASLSVTGGGTFLRNILWDNVTNSWIVCGTTNFIKVDCDTLATTLIPVPTGQVGTQYVASVAYGGKLYSLPLVSVTASTKVAIVDLVNNTSTLSANTIGVTGGFWGGVLTSVGTIYFVREVGSATTIYEYNPATDTGTNFGNMAGNTGYGVVNLPDGNVFIAPVNTATGFSNQTCYIVNPNDKSVQTLSNVPFSLYSGLCVGQSGIVYGLRSQSTGTAHGIFGFDPKTNTGFTTQYAVQRPTGGQRGFQDMFSLADGRLILMPGLLNSGRLVYYSYLENPNNNTFPNIGTANPIIPNGKGL